MFVMDHLDNTPVKVKESDRWTSQDPNLSAVRHQVSSNEFLVSKETVVLRRWERSEQKFAFIKRVDKG